MTDALDYLKDLPLPLQLLYWAKRRPDAVALRQKLLGVWRPVTWAAYAQQSRWFGLGLLKLGLRPGQSMAVLSENRQEWVFAELGAALIGGITTGVYPTSPAQEVEYLQLDKVLSVRQRLPHLRAIVVIDPRGLRRYERAGLHDFADVVTLGERFEAECLL